MAPTVVYVSNGKLIQNIEAVLVFVRIDAADWADTARGISNPPPVSFVCEVASFVGDLVDSAYLDAVGAAYSRPSVPIGRGTLAGVYFLDVPPAPPDYNVGPRDVLDSDIQAAITEALATGALPGVTENTCYVIIVPAEVLSAQGLTGTPQGGGAYHGQIFLGASTVPYCVIGLGALSTYSLAISHEIVEMITDSDVKGWQDTSTNPRREVADVCELITTRSFHGNNVSAFFSPVTNSCETPVDDANDRQGVNLWISGGPSYCSGGIQVGRPFKVRAGAVAKYNGRPQAIVLSEWSATQGATIQQSMPGPSVTGPSVTVVPPSSPGQFEVALSATTECGCTLTAHRTFVAMTREQSDWNRRLCALLNRIPRMPPVHPNPLWDPLRDLATRPLTKAEIAEIKAYAASLSSLADHLETAPAYGLEPESTAPRR